LAYQSFGFLFGDLSLSPLYVYQSIFSERLKQVQNEDAIFGAFSLIFWTLSIVSLLKYAVILLSVDDNGEGKDCFALFFCQTKVLFLLITIIIVLMLVHATRTGGIVALYSQLCRNAKFCLLPNHQASDEELSTYLKLGSSNRSIPPSPLKRFIEKHKSTKKALLIFFLLGACMVICVGALMPAISGNFTFFSLQICYCVWWYNLSDLMFYDCISYIANTNSILQFFHPLKAWKLKQRLQTKVSGNDANLPPNSV